jgi:hypothetical protein
MGMMVCRNLARLLKEMVPLVLLTWVTGLKHVVMAILRTGQLAALVAMKIV